MPWHSSFLAKDRLVEEAEGNMTAFECKWNEKAKVHFPSTFKDAYPEADLQVATPEGFERLIGFV